MKDGQYDKYVDLGLTYSKLQNPAQRHFLGLKDDDRGVLIPTVVAAGPCAKSVKSGDVLLSIDDHPIASDATVVLEGERVEMPEVVERKFKGDKVKLEIWRDKQNITTNVELDTVYPYLIQGHAYDVRPRYLVYGGLLFQPLNLELIDAYQPSDLRLRHFFDFFVLEQIYLEHPEVIVLTNILPDPINTYLERIEGALWTMNGKNQDTCRSGQSVREPADRFVVNLIGDCHRYPRSKQVEAARERITTLQRDQGTNLKNNRWLSQPPRKTGKGSKQSAGQNLAIVFALLLPSVDYGREDEPALPGVNPRSLLVRVNVTGQP